MPFVDLFNDETTERLEGLYSDLASYDDIDGILFQDDLIWKHNEGFRAAGRGPYRQEHWQARLNAKGLT